MNVRSPKTSFSEMPVSELGVYMMDIHHPYLRQALSTYVICSGMIGAANREPGMKILGNLLLKLGRQIEQHLRKNEETIFPFFRLMLQNGREENPSRLVPILKKIKAEHTSIRKLFKKVRLLSNDYTPAEGAEANIRLCFAQLFDFEQDILKHVFLEEEILFPKLLK